MKLDVIIYEISILLLITILIYIGLIIRKLIQVINKKSDIWILPIIAGAILIISLLSHIIANFILLPQLDFNIKLLQENLLKGGENLNNIKNTIVLLKGELLQLRTVSFSCFFIASILLTLTTGIYIKWISK